jgi:RNA polymerase-binding protein DksA
MNIDSDHFRGRLLEERERVQAAIKHLRTDHPGSLDDETEEVTGSSDNHLAETASATLNREIDYTLEENAEHVLQAINEALERIDEGTFGTCRRCGKPIAEERLDAIPYANRCIDCKRLEERG